MKKPILIVLANAGFDPTEAAIPWLCLTQHGEQVHFATPDGQAGVADPLMVTGEGLDVWGWLPVIKKIKLLGLILRANKQARAAYAAMIQSPAYQHPIAYQNINLADYDGILFPGGHAKTIKPYLENETLYQLAQTCLAANSTMPVAAICHGVLVLARAKDGTGQSILANRRITALTWDLERKAWLSARFSRFWEPNYYRTYLESAHEPSGYWSVEHEIKRCLIQGQFINVPATAAHYWLKTNGLTRDTHHDSRSAWVVQDGNLLTARWPGDAHLFARTFNNMIQDYRQQVSA